MERPVPYRGEDGYIFISYAHRDSDRVWPVVARLQADGYRVWYDEGIDPGTEWDENIAAHVAGCGYFIAFLSENYLASNNCKDELNFSRDQGKPQLLIYLEDVELPSGMAMRLGRNQAVFREHCTEEEFYEKIYEAQDIRCFQGTNRAPKEGDTPKRAQRSFRKKKVSLWPVVIAVLLIAAAVAATRFWPKAPEEVPQPSVEVIPESAEPEIRQAENVLLADNDQLRISALKTSVDSRYFTLTLSVENKSKSDVYLELKNLYLNGVLCEHSGYGISLIGGEMRMWELHWEQTAMERRGINPEAVTVLEGEISGYYQDDSDKLKTVSVTYYPYGEENAAFFTYEPDADDVVLLDTGEFFIAATDNWVNEDNAWVQQVVCINRLDEDRIFSVEEERVNHHLIRTYWNTWVKAGRIAYGEITVARYQWEPTGYDRLLCLEGQWHIYDWDNNFSGENIITYPFVHYPQGEAAAEVLAPRQLTQEELLFENQYIRAGYLGCHQDADKKMHMLYLCNLGSSVLDCSIHVLADAGYSSVYYLLGANEEAVNSFYLKASLPEGSPEIDVVFRWMETDGISGEKTVKLRLDEE